MDDFLAIPREEWIDDLFRLMALFYERYAHLLALPHVLNPAFRGCSDIGPSDADIIVDGCLIAIKADVEQRVQSTWLRHLAGCVLLDYDQGVRPLDFFAYLEPDKAYREPERANDAHLVTAEQRRLRARRA